MLALFESRKEIDGRSLQSFVALTVDNTHCLLVGLLAMLLDHLIELLADVKDTFNLVRRNFVRQVFVGLIEGRFQLSVLFLFERILDLLESLLESLSNFLLELVLFSHSILLEILQKFRHLGLDLLLELFQVHLMGVHFFILRQQSGELALAVL